MIPDYFKQQLLNRVDIVDVIERHVQLRKAGQNYVARCPFHNEKTPSFSVSPTKQFYHCFGCGVNGNAITFVMEHGGVGYIDAIKELAGMVGMIVPEPRYAEGQRPSQPAPEIGGVLTEAARFYKEQLKRSEPAIAYLKQRGLNGEIAARFGLGYAPAGWQALAELFPDYKSSSALKEAGLVIDGDGGRRYDRFRDRVMFPILNARGAVIGFGGRVIGDGEPKYLNSPETPLFEKGRELYGLFQARQGLRESGRVVVVEGYMDVVALAQHGVGGTVATLGTATTPVHVEKLLRLTDEIVFCFDGDSAGRRAAWRALEVSLAKLSDGKSIRFLFLPEEHDPDSYVRTQGADAFEAALGNASPLSEFLLRELASQSDAATPEGRARLLHLAKPLIAQVPAPALAMQLRRRLAELAQVSLAEVEELFGVRRQRPGAFQRPALAAPQRRGPVTLTRRVLRVVLSDPTLAERVDRAVLDASDRHFSLLIEVLDVVAARPGLGSKEVIPVLLEALPDGPLRAQLHEEVAELLSGPEIDVKAEFDQTVARLAADVAKRREALLSAKTDRSHAEQEEFVYLVRSRVQQSKVVPEVVKSRV